MKKEKNNRQTQRNKNNDREKRKKKRGEKERMILHGREISRKKERKNKKDKETHLDRPIVAQSAIRSPIAYNSEAAIAKMITERTRNAIK